MLICQYIVIIVFLVCIKHISFEYSILPKKLSISVTIFIRSAFTTYITTYFYHLSLLIKKQGGEFGCIDNSLSLDNLLYPAFYLTRRKNSSSLLLSEIFAVSAVKSYINPETASATASYRGEFIVSRRISYGSSLFDMNIFIICTEKPEQRIRPRSFC